MIAGKKETMAFLMSGCPLISVIIEVGDMKSEFAPLVETQAGFIAHWAVKYDRPLPGEFEVFKEMDTSFQLIAGVNCPEALFLRWFIALSDASGVSFVALDSDGLLVSK